MSKAEVGKEKRIRSFDPMELAIDGGKVLCEEESGPLDTEVDIDSALYDPGLLEDLEPAKVANINALGVLVPIKYAIRDGVPFVVAGKTRVRSARRINRERIATGQPLLRVDGSIEASKDENRLMGVLIAENAVRKIEGFSAVISNLRRYMGRGIPLEDAAVTFGMPIEKAKAWIDFDDGAIDVVRDFVHRNVMSVSAGIEIMRAGGPDAQRAALVALFEDVGLVAPVDSAKPDPRPLQTVIDEANKTIASQKPDKRTGKTPAQTKLTGRAARSAAKRVTAPTTNQGVPDKRTQNKLLQALRDLSHSGKSDKTISFWEGAENMLTLIIGGEEAKETDARLVELLKGVRKAMKAKGGK